MPRLNTVVLLLFVALLFIAPASAFGAGEVPPASEFKGYVWRHGDITEVLKFLPVSFITHHRFTQLQRKQIYFGNWLRDFSQVIDTTCLENVPEPILRAIVSVLAFMEFGFATDEFDVTRERLGCYTHAEHIDNPRGYPDNAQEIDERLRGPVDPRELEFDPKTGMKNYIANSGNGWPTAAAYIREQLEQCIAFGRKGKGTHHHATKESFRYLGAALHTLEDFSAHSNFIELCLRELGETNVFPYVGDACNIKTPGLTGRTVAPIVTGTFGMLDIFHSLLGEADDMAVLQSKGSLGELESKLGYGGVAFDQLFELIKKGVEAVSKVSSESSALLQQLNAVRNIFIQATEDTGPGPWGSDNVEGIMNPNLLWQSIEPIFYLHDRMRKWLQDGTEEPEESKADISSNQLSEYTNQLTFRFLAVMIESSVKELRNAVRAAKERVDSEAAKASSAEVFQDGSDASDPSHSDLSKDHFSNVLNQPAGLVATVTTNWVTQQVVKCWDNPALDANNTIDEILSILHHPAFSKKKTDIQLYMFKTVKCWWEENSAEEKDRLRSMLTKESVRNRGHEDHELNLKDLVKKGKHRGPGSFPGSQPKVKQPPKKLSFPLTWAVNELLSDVNWAYGTAKKGISDPLGAAGDVIKGAGSLVLRTSQSVLGAPKWVADQIGGLASRIWPFNG